MPRETSTTTSFRLTRSEAELIRPGLLRLIISHRHWQDRGTPLISPASFHSLPHPADEGEFSAACQAIILHVAVVATNSFKAQSRRLHFDPFELAACILGVRATEMMARHGHLEPCPLKYKVRCRRLLKKLERFRKRAKRAYIMVHGGKAYAEASHCWQQYVRFVRTFFLFCTCNRTLLPDVGGRRLRRLIEDQWMQYFREELSFRGLEIPPQTELRGLVKRALRVGRRFIRQYGRITSHDHHDLLQERIVNYVVRRCRKTRTSKVKKVRSVNCRFKLEACRYE